MDFNTRGRKSGSFRTPGSLHIHFGSTDAALIDRIGMSLHATIAKGHMSSDNTIVEVVKGRQAEEDPEMFSAHNAADDQHERFLTFDAHDRNDAVRMLKFVLMQWKQEVDLRIEAERALLHYSMNGREPEPKRWWQTSEIYSQEIGFRKDEARHRVETHLCFDVPKTDETRPPIVLKQLKDKLEKLGVFVMSWSLFYSKEYWSYRSSAFIDPVECEEICKKEWAVFAKFLRTEKLHPKNYWLAGELLLGLWSTPLEKYEETRYSSQVGFGELIGAPSFEVPVLSEVISEGKSARKEASKKTLPVFQQIIINAGLEPILLELAINHDLSKENISAAMPDHDTKYFTSHIMSYQDSADSLLLNAWQRAISGIVEGSQQINPIVFHDETYQFGCLSERVDWAGQATHVLGKKEARQTEFRLHEKSAMQDYPYKPDEFPAPVHCTLRILSAGLVGEVANTVPRDRASLSAILRKLRSAILFVVPFSWPFRSPRDSQWGKGGCLFAVVGPGKLETVDEQVIRDIAMRCGLILSKAALAEASERIKPARKEGFFAESHRQWVLRFREVKKALYGAMDLEGAQRLARIMPLLEPWPEKKKERKPVLERLLKNAKGITEAWDAILENAFPKSKAVANRWRKSAGFKHWSED